MVNGREHAYQPFGEAKRRRAHLEEVLAYAARPEAEFPEGFTVLSEIRENFLVMCVRDGRKKLLLMSDSQLFEWPMQSIHLAVDHPEDDLYGQDEDVVMDDTIACYALVVPEIPPPPRPCHGPVYAPVVSEDYW